MTIYKLEIKFAEDRKVDVEIEPSTNEIRLQNNMPALSGTEYEIFNSVVAQMRKVIAAVDLQHIKLTRTGGPGE